MDAAAARGQLVNALRQSGRIGDARVDAAMRWVPRHIFVPEASVEDAYLDTAIVTKRGADGMPISSASQPAIVAAMLEQLDLAPGQRVLEIGAGTGYNAALLAHIVGDRGRVTTIDIDADVTERARASLEAAGFPDVLVVCGDGGLGFEENAPYDRIVVTVGAWDLPPAWHAQVGRPGRLVVPLGIRGVQRSIAFTPDQDLWRSQSILDCGFMPMRGPFGDPGQRIEIGGGVTLRMEDAQTLRAEAMNTHLAKRAADLDAGISATAREVGTTLSLWLALTEPTYCALLATADAVAAGTVTPPVELWGGETFAPALVETESLAYATPRDAGSAMPINSDEPNPLGVRGHGPAGATLAERLQARMQEWDRHDRLPTARLHIDAYPRSTPDDQIAARHVINKPHTRLAVSWS